MGRIGNPRAGMSWKHLAGCCALALCAPLALQAQQAAPERRAVPGAGASAPAQQTDPTAETQHENPDPYADLPAPTGKPAPTPQDQERKTEDVQLKGVEVQGKHDVLHDADKRLKALQDSLPCSGCDVPPRKKKFVRRMVDKAINEITPQPPPERSHEVNDKAQEYSQDGQCIGVNDARRCAPENTRP